MNTLTKNIIDLLFEKTDKSSLGFVAGIISENLFLSDSLKDYFASSLSPMQALELYAKIEALKASIDDNALNPIGPLLSDVIWDKPDWQDDKRLEPGEILNFIKNMKTPEAVGLYQSFNKNLNSIVLLAHQDIIVNRKNLEDGSQTNAVLSIKPLIKINYGGQPIYRRFPYIRQDSIQSDVASGTGFFISEDSVATAYHVLRSFKDIQNSEKNRSLKELVIINGFYVTPGKENITIAKDRIFKMADPDADKFDKVSTLDLDKEDSAHFKVVPAYKTGIVPAYVEMSDEPVTCGTDVYMLGHGFGLPVKLSWNGPVINSSNLASCKIESFPGNSGSPVFHSESHKVVGILKGYNTTEVLRKVVENGKTYHVPICYLHGSYATRFSHIEHVRLSFNNPATTTPHS